MDELEQVGVILAAIMTPVISWIRAAITGDAQKIEQAQYATANAIADAIEKQKFGNKNAGS